MYCSNERRLLFIGFSLLCFITTAKSSSLVLYISQTYGIDNNTCLNNTCLNNTMYCKSLDYALRGIVANNDISLVNITIVDDVYLVKKLLQIDLEHNRTLSLHISGGNKSVSMVCSNDSRGIFDLSGPNLSLEFHHVIFKMCGRNKTLMPVIMVNDTQQISFFSCQFQDNLLSGLLAINTPVIIEECKFENNSVANDNISCGELCDISDSMGGALSIVFRNEKRNMSVHIHQTEFLNNSIYVDNSRYYAAEKETNISLRGGAVYIKLGGKSSLQTIVNVSKCRFESNRATLGGALHIQLLDLSMSNVIEITETNFSQNHGSQVGGAFMMSLWDHSTHTELRMTDVWIEHNWSRSGSGIYIFLKSEKSSPEISSKQVFLFKRVNVLNNLGPTGSGVKIVSPIFGRRVIGVLPVFEDCNFVNNTNSLFNNYGCMASFIVDRVDVNFTGTNVFSGNKFYGAALFSSSLVHIHGNLSFIGNVAQNGGGLFMQHSQIVLHPETQILFKDNIAGMLGGAIHVVTNPIYRVAVVNNPECFITYSEQGVSPGNWNVTVSFINNTAALKGAAINIDSLILCGWDIDSQSIVFGKSLKWNKNFIYRGNIVRENNLGSNKTCHCDISTSVNKLEQRRNISNNNSIQIAPGELSTLDIAGYDELNNSVFTVIGDFAFERDGTPPQWLKLKKQFYIIQPDGKNQVDLQYTSDEKIQSIPQSAKLFFLDLWSSEIPNLAFNITRKECNPGFKYRKKSGTCVCRNDTGIIGCTTDGQYVRFKPGYWIGKINGTFTVMPCPFGYCRCPKLGTKETDESNGCFFRSSSIDNQSLVCANHRKGDLCGDCMENFTVGIQSFKCVKRKQGWSCTFISVLSIIFTILFCILVVCFNPGLDIDLRGPLFFFQVLPLFFPPISYNEIHDYHIYDLVFILSSIFDFTIPFVGYFNPKCYLFEDLNNEHMLAFGYSSTVLALLVFSVAFLLSYKRIILIRRKNAVQCFWLLLILMYTSLTKTSFQILNCSHIAGEYRLFAQASRKCFKGTHLAMGIVAVIIVTICAIVIPLLIIALTTSSLLRIDPHYVDTLTKNLKPECSWWWVVDLLRRLLLVVLAVYVPIWNHRQVFLIIASMLILTIHCYFQPYDVGTANAAEAIFLFVLSGIAVLQMVDMPAKNQATVYMIIVCLMLSYTILVIIYKLFMYIKRRVAPVSNSADYESLDGTSRNMTEANLEQSVQERKEKIDALFSRSEDSLSSDDN